MKILLIIFLLVTILSCEKEAPQEETIHTFKYVVGCNTNYASEIKYLDKNDSLITLIDQPVWWVYTWKSTSKGDKTAYIEAGSYDAFPNTIIRVEIYKDGKKVAQDISYRNVKTEFKY